MNILDGTARAEEILRDLVKRVAQLPTQPRLVVIFVDDNPVTRHYVTHKATKAESVGIEVRIRQFPRSTTTRQLRKALHVITHHPRTSGVIVQLPLPEHINTPAVLDVIPLQQDVDALSSRAIGRLFNDRPIFYPPTACGIIDLLEANNISISGQHVVLLGSGRLVGRPSGFLFLSHNATVTFTHDHTHDIKAITRQADILVSGVGKPGLVTAEWIKEGAVVVDAGTSDIGGAVVGDVDMQSVTPRVAALAPVPGGVGPMTIAKLLENIVIAKERKQ